MKKINRNFFKLSMFICLCLMIVTLISATVCRPPGQPEPPKIVEIGPTWCIIEYTAPDDDGGCAITGYRIGYRYEGGLWNVAPSKATSLRVKLSPLKEGKKVEFRVSAINDAGEGAPSGPSEMVLLE